MAELATRSCSSCGFTKTYATEAKAAGYFPRHSCERQRQLVERAARVAARQTNTGRVVDCTHTRSRHEHGTALAYLRDACRCAPCRLAKNAAECNTRRLKAYGRFEWVDPAPAIAHVRSLMAAGMGLPRIVEVSGISSATAKWLLYPTGGGTRQRISRRHAETLLAITVDLAAHSTVEPTGTVRRLQALAAVGWSGRQVAHAAGVNRGTLTGILNGSQRPWRVTAEAVAAAYDQLWDQTPPAGTPVERSARGRVIAHAQRRGWAPPLAWDDDTIDDPDARPAHDAQPGGDGRNATAIIEVDEVELLVDLGRDRLAAKLGVRPNSLQQALERAGRRDLWRRLAELPAEGRAA